MVILHGLYGSSDNWISIGRALADDFEVYLVDQRNHGRSPHDDQHNYEAMRNDLLDFLTDAGLDRIILAGHSMGGKTAMCFAANFPGRVEKLIVVDMAPKSYRILIRKEVPSHYDILKAMKEVDFTRISGRREVDRMLAPVIKQRRIRAFLMKNLGKTDDNRYFWKLNLNVLLRDLDNIMGDINENCFEPGAVPGSLPVLFIRGENSPYILDRDMDIIKKIFPSAELETISGAGHWLHAEQPEAFIDVLRRFAG